MGAEGSGGAEGEPEDDPEEAEDAGNDEGGTPAVMNRDGRDEEWGERGAERSSGVGDAEAEGTAFGGRVAETVARPAGKVAPSPKPRSARARHMPPRPSMRAWLAEARDQSETATRTETHRPRRSIQCPQMGLPSM